MAFPLFIFFRDNLSQTLAAKMTLDMRSSFFLFTFRAIFFFFGFQRDKEKYDEVPGHTNNAYNVATNPFRAAS